MTYFNNLGQGRVGFKAPSGGVTPSLLLDTYTNSSIGFSMHKLRAAYSGSGIRVRRSSDNTTQEIGFVNNYLDTASLLSFVGAGNGFIHTWYDQSGNGNNLVQLTPGNQPQIVASGSLITRNGIACIRATSTQFLTITTQVVNNTSHSWWFSYEKNDTSTNAILLVNGSVYMYMDYGASQYVGNTDLMTISPTLSANTFRLMNSVYQYPSSAINIKLYANGSQIATRTTSDVPGTARSSFTMVPSSIYRTATVHFNELLLWKTDQTTNRSAIETDIKTRNLIY